MSKIEKIITTIGGFVLFWIFISWVDVAANNLNGAIYQSWNFFEIFF